MGKLKKVKGRWQHSQESKLSLKRDNQELYDATLKRIKETQYYLRIHYQSADEALGNVIHDSMKTLYDLKNILFDLLLMGLPAREVLQIMKKRSNF